MGVTTPHELQLTPAPAPAWALALIGAAAGTLSGLFGIGGGIVIVPLLILAAGLPHRLAAGTSVGAILPAAIVGATAYTIMGEVYVPAALALACGILIGAQIGGELLARLPVIALQLAFLGFLVIVSVSLWFVVPDRGGEFSFGVTQALALALTGAVTGVLSGILGIGGGVVVVPILIMLFGASDLVAKGTSLVMMIPGSISASLRNWKRGNIQLRTALIVGVAAAACTPLGAMLAARLDPFVANVSFSVLLGLIMVQLVVRIVRERRATGGASA